MINGKICELKFEKNVFTEPQRIVENVSFFRKLNPQILITHLYI